MRTINIYDTEDMYKIAFVVNKGWEYDYARCGWKKDGVVHMIPKDQDGYCEGEAEEMVETEYWLLSDAFRKEKDIDFKIKYLIGKGWNYFDDNYFTASWQVPFWFELPPNSHFTLEKAYNIQKEKENK